MVHSLYTRGGALNKRLMEKASATNDHTVMFQRMDMRRRLVVFRYSHSVKVVEVVRSRPRRER